MSTRLPTDSAQDALASAQRVRLLSALQHSPGQTADELADTLGVHKNTVREHLARLAAGGFVVSEPEHRTERGRPRILYSAADGLHGDNPAAVAQTGRALALGRAYRAVYPGSADEQLDLLEDHLDRCGFEPTPGDDELTVGLTCPFDSLYEAMDSGLCAVHAQVIRSILARTDGDLDVAELRRTGGPDAPCRLRLRRDGPRALPGPAAARP